MDEVRREQCGPEGGGGGRLKAQIHRGRFFGKQPLNWPTTDASSDPSSPARKQSEFLHFQSNPPHSLSPHILPNFMFLFLTFFTSFSLLRSVFFVSNPDVKIHVCGLVFSRMRQIPLIPALSSFATFSTSHRTP